MKVYLQNDKAFMDDNDNIVELTKTGLEKSKNKMYYVLPENSLNRKYLYVDKLKEMQTIDYGNKVKVSRTIGTSAGKWQDYLTEEERETIKNIEEECKKRLEAAKELKKPQTEKEKLLAKIAKLQAQVAKYEAE